MQPGPAAWALVLLLVLVLAALIMLVGSALGSAVVRGGALGFGDAPNPPLVVEEVPGTPLRVVRDDLLQGGTKARGWRAIERLARGKRGLVYAGPATGHTQIVLARVGRRLGVPFTMVTSRAEGPAVRAAANAGARHVFHPGARLAELQAAASRRAGLRGETLVDLGLAAVPGYVREVGAALRRAHAATRPRPAPFRRIWVAAGSGATAAALRLAFPRARLMLVQVGRPVERPDANSEVFIAPEGFYEPASHPPPYPSVATYDAKVWQFARSLGEAGDVIWNVAAD